MWSASISHEGEGHTRRRPHATRSSYGRRNPCGFEVWILKKKEKYITKGGRGEQMRGKGQCLVINYVAERGGRGEDIRILWSETSCIFFRLIMVERQATCLRSYHASVKTNEQYIISKNNNIKEAEVMDTTSCSQHWYITWRRRPCAKSIWTKKALGREGRTKSEAVEEAEGEEEWLAQGGEPRRARGANSERVKRHMT